MNIPLLAAALLTTLTLHAQEWKPTKFDYKEPDIKGRTLDAYRHGVKPEWGYAKAQEDTFVVMHPAAPRKNAPLYVVLHSAGHAVESCLECTKKVGNHDIYHAPPDHYALYLDCRKNKGDWWWGGMHLKDADLTRRNSGGDPMPVERRVIDTVKWVVNQYGLDPNRVYLAGNSMGGSGALGIGMRHGDVFAAIKANVPAGIEHVSHRMYFTPQTVPTGLKLPDPPVCIDYSAPDDGWSAGHERFVSAMNERKYSLYYYWGPFGHANNSSQIKKSNDLIDSLDWLSIRKDEAYAVFTNASDRDPLPWPDDLKSKASGQINAFVRWKNVRDAADGMDMALFLVSEADLKTTFNIPAEVVTDVTLRRVQNFSLQPGQTFQWTYGAAKGESRADAQGLITIPGLKLTKEPVTLMVRK